MSNKNMTKIQRNKFIKKSLIKAHLFVYMEIVERETVTIIKKNQKLFLTENVTSW